MSTIGKLFNKSIPILLLSSRSSPPSSSSLFPHYQHSLVRHSMVSASSKRGLPSTVTLGVLFPGFECERNHYVCQLALPGFEFDSHESILQHFVKTFAKALGGDEEEAKTKIYFVQLQWYAFMFGAVVDEEIKKKLDAMGEIMSMHPDDFVDVRRNSESVKSISDFTLINRNQRLHNMFNYQQSTACKNGENSGHWLINIKEPVHGPDKVIYCCIQTLAKVFGSEKEARERIYALWCIEPFGFGAEMDVEASKKLREQPNVLQVLPDCAFDVKDKDKLGVLIVCSRHDSTHDLTHDSTHDLTHDSTVMIDYIDDLSYYKSLDEETDDDEESEDEDEVSEDEQSE